MKFCKEPQREVTCHKQKDMAKTQEQGFSENGNISHKNYS